MPQNTQQQGLVKGSVVDNNNDPIIGANVKVVGATTGTITDIDGNFSIKAAQGDKLHISYVGYVNQTVTVKGGTLKIVMDEDAKSLDEVVVVGYGAQKMKNLTTAIATVSPNEISDIASGNLAATLKGLVAGVSASGGEARPGVGATIQIRGKDPQMYVIDDIQYEAADGLAAFNNLDPSEIESISILKDAAAAVYGSRGGQGAILVKTKHGKIGKPKVSYAGQFTYNDAVDQLEYLNSYDYGVLYNARAGGDLNNPIAAGKERTSLFQADELEAMKNINYDWIGNAWSSATSMKHSVTISGGTKNATYFAGGSFFTQDGNIGYTKDQRWNFRAGADINVASGLKVGLQVSGNWADRANVFSKAGGENLDNDYNTIATTPPYIPWELGGHYLQRWGVNNKQQNAIQQHNYYALMDLHNETATSPNNLNISANATYDFSKISNYLKGLSVKINYSRSVTQDEARQWGSKYEAISFKERGGSGNHLYIEDGINLSKYPGGLLDPANIVKANINNGNRMMRDMTKTTTYQVNFGVNYSRKFGDHDVSALFNVEKSERDYHFVRYLKEGPLIEDWTYESNAALAPTLDGGTSRTDREVSGRLGYVGRVNYSYRDRYLAELLLRSDANTRFAPENYWEVFWSMSAGWVMSEETWFKNNIKWMNFLKLRLSYGKLGNDGGIALWQWTQTYGFNQNRGFIFGGDKAVGFGFETGNAPNRYIHWETDYKYNFGIDARFLDSRLSFGLDYYYTKVRDGITTRGAAIPVTVGAKLAPENYNESAMYGLELSFGWRDRIGDFKYNASFNLTMDGDKVTKMDWPNAFAFDSPVPGGPSSTGKWMLKSEGILRTQADVDAYIKKYNIVEYFGEKDLSKIRPGMLAFADVRGKRGELDENGFYQYAAPDGVIDDDDKINVWKKRFIPYGTTLGLGVEWKGISLNTQLGITWGGGYDIMIAQPSDLKKMEYTNIASIWKDMYLEKDVLDAKGNVVAPANIDARWPNYQYKNTLAESTFWHVSSFRMNIKRLTLAYSLPKKVTDFLKIQNCRFNLTGNNILALYNPYPGNIINPMANATSYPTLRTWTLGLNVTF